MSLQLWTELPGKALAGNHRNPRTGSRQNSVTLMLLCCCAPLERRMFLSERFPCSVLLPPPVSRPLEVREAAWGSLKVAVWRNKMTGGKLKSVWRWSHHKNHLNRIYTNRRHMKRKDIDINFSFLLEKVGLMQTTEDQKCQTKCS